MVTIAMIGSHSAEEIAVSAKAAGLKTAVICQKGREELYAKHNDFLFDNIFVFDKFKDILWTENQQKLLDLDAIFIPNRSFSVYVGYDEIENDFQIPIYGNRKLLRIEDRNYERNQYWLMKQAGMRYPKQFTKDSIDRLVIVKVQQKNKPLERAFFYANSPEEFRERGEALVKEGIIAQSDLRSPVIEEFILGPRFNANFHAYALPEDFGSFDFVGFDDRIQTNLSGILNLPAKDQLQVSVPLKNEEVGHFGVTMRESKKPLVYEAAEQFMKGVKEYFPPQMIGLFCLQGAVTEDSEFVIFDISPRIPGAPCLGTTSPEMRRLSLKVQTQISSPLDLTMMEIKIADNGNMIQEITT